MHDISSQQSQWRTQISHVVVTGYGGVVGGGLQRKTEVQQRTLVFSEAQGQMEMVSTQVQAPTEVHVAHVEGSDSQQEKLAMNQRHLKPVVRRAEKHGGHRGLRS